MFDDSDYGPSCAGENDLLIGAYRCADTVQQICDEYNPVLALAEKEHIVFPVQKNNQILLDRFGFTLDGIDQQGANFRLCVKIFDLV
jgi:hypothetical protein